MNPETPSPTVLQSDISPVPRASRRGLPVWQLPLVALALVAGGTWLFAQGQPATQYPGGPQPAFGILTASPPNIVFNTPTIVTFTIPIDTPTLNPTTVELQLVDVTGRFQSTLARMFDNGKSGDQTPGDRIFTAQVRLNESAVGKANFRVAAAFRGNQLNGQSAVAFVDVDPFALPPDPGEAGKQTLEGVDSDQDGVRDDVQRWIAINHQSDSQAIATLNRYAAVSQQVILAIDKATVMSLMVAQSRAAACWDRRYPVDNRNALRQLREQSINTDVRFAAYLGSQSLVSGETFHTFSRDPSVCQP